MGLLGGDRHGPFYLEQDGAVAKMIEAGVNPGPRRCQRCVILRTGRNNLTFCVRALSRRIYQAGNISE